MRELSIDEIKRIELEILISFDKFCRENELKYSLAYGTLIGAVRHKGFIPWDDDIDVWMPRPDYDYFVNRYEDKRFVLLCNEKGDYWQEFGKLIDSSTVAIPTNNKGMGVFIDVFPVDGLPNNSDSFKKKLLKQYHFFRKMRSANLWKNDKSKFRFIFKIIELFYPTKELFHKFEKNKQKYSFLESNYSWDLYLEFESSDFNDRIELEFEKIFFLSLAKYDKYLRAYYGDYLKYPPVEKRVSGHNYKYYYKES